MQPEKFSAARVLFLPWLIHGLYDYLQLMPIPTGIGVRTTVEWFILGANIAMLGCGYMWFHWEWVKLCSKGAHRMLLIYYTFESVLVCL